MDPDSFIVDYSVTDFSLSCDVALAWKSFFFPILKTTKEIVGIALFGLPIILLLFFPFFVTILCEPIK